VLSGLAAAISFGVSAPLAKRLLDNAEPQMLAGILYLGAFIALSIVRPRSRSEARLRRSDAPRTTAMIVAGGVIAPVLLLLGLERVSGVAGTVNVALALIIGEHLPETLVLIGALALGAVSFGLSVYLDALALRSLGAAREAAVFAVAPFAGALLAPLVLPETLGIRDLAAGALMAVGVVRLLREQHEHTHRHEPLDHDHAHVHDEHHQHVHDADALPGEPHSHPHHHDELVHTHPHVSDIRRRHAHSK
jgi:drug/metabolite transporter (DMT)-like permease